MTSILSNFMEPLPMLLCLMSSSCVSLSMFNSSICGSMGNGSDECRKFTGYSMPSAACLGCVAFLFVFMSVSGGGMGGGGMGGGYR